MIKIINHRRLSEILQEILDLPDDGLVSFREIVALFGERSFPLLMICFALPAAIPIPFPPGVSLIFGLPLMFLSWQMLRLDYPNLPNWFLNKKIKINFAKKIIRKSIKYVIKIEEFSKIRGEYFIDRYGTKIVAFIAIICSAMITAPLIFNKTLPSIALIIMCLGLANRDIILILAGIILSFFSMSIILILVFFGSIIYKGFFGKII